jgi:antitoxin (DNA-binding transcriptional repressor) of toxin-antitoxin stability system
MYYSVVPDKEKLMVTLPVGEFKAHFSEILKKVENGEEFVISYGKRKQKVAAIIPFKKFASSRPFRKIGILKGKAGFRISDDFKMTDEEFLQS